MKSLLLRAISIRKRLNRTNKSYVRSEQFISNLEYWIANGANVDQIVQKWEKEVRLMMPPNMMKEFESAMKIIRLKQKAELVTEHYGRINPLI